MSRTDGEMKVYRSSMTAITSDQSVNIFINIYTANYFSASTVIMHGSIPAVTIPPRAIPPGFVFFLQECSKFPTPGTLKLNNSPPRGIATLYC